MDRVLDSLFDLVVSLACTDTHVSHTAALHDCSDICKVYVYETVLGDEVGDSLNTLSENVICHCKCLEHRCVLFARVDQLVIRDDDQRVNKVAEILDALCSAVPALLALECERLCDYSYCKSSAVHRCLCDDRSCSCTCAAAHSGSNEYHVGILDVSDHFVDRFLGSLLTYLRVSSCSAASRDLFAELDLYLSLTSRKSLPVCIDANECHALQSGINHAVDGIASAAADSDYFNDSCAIRF